MRRQRPMHGVFSMHAGTPEHRHTEETRGGLGGTP